MSEQPPTGERKTYSVPLLRCYGSVVATTRGSSTVTSNDSGGSKTGKAP